MFKKVGSMILVLSLVITLFPLSPRAADAFDNGLAQQLTFAPPVVDTAQVGYGIQRTMRLLETSSAEDPHTVRIAFCGQSITDGNPWTNAIIAFVKNKYPTVDLQSKNFGIGGYNTWLQKDIIENDITSFYPDIVFFYDYGDMGIYESMIQLIREKTVAEVIIQNDHLDNGSGFGSDDNSFNYLPAIANRLNCELADVRTYWKNYMNANGLAVTDFLSDGIVHLNAQGQALMYEILKQYFVYKLVDEATFDDRITKLTVGSSLQWSGRSLTVPFTGNRIEVVSPLQTPASVAVLVNNKKPSNFVELLNNTRYTNLGTHVFAAYFRKIIFLKPSVPQTWEILFTKINTNNYDYTLYGSLAGNQGSGNTAADFTSTDGTLLLKSQYFYKLTPPSQNGRLVFDTTLNGTDTLTFSGVEKIASNLPSNTNTLLLQNASDTVPNISYFRVYRPGFLLAAPRVNPITLGTNFITGKTNKGATVSVKINGVLFPGAAGATDGLFTVVVPKVAAGSIVDVTASLGSAKSQLFRYKLDGAMPTPLMKRIDKVYSNSTVVTGAASNSAVVTITIGTKTYHATASAVNGSFKVTIPKSKPGTILKLKATLYAVASVVKSIKVIPSKPKINAVNVRAKTISGTSYPASVVKITYNAKTIYTVKATSKGTFSVKVKGKMVAGKYITASMKYAGLTSDVAKIKVGK